MFNASKNYKLNKRMYEWIPSHSKKAKIIWIVLIVLVTPNWLLEYFDNRNNKSEVVHENEINIMTI